jgi:hypothetical protein
VILAPTEAMQLPLFVEYQDWPVRLTLSAGRPGLAHCSECLVWVQEIFAELERDGILHTETILTPPHGGWPVSAASLAKRDMLERMWFRSRGEPA